MNDSKEKPRQYSPLEVIGAVVALSGFLAALSWFLGTYYDLELGRRGSVHAIHKLGA